MTHPDDEDFAALFAESEAGTTARERRLAAPDAKVVASVGAEHVAHKAEDRGERGRLGQCQGGAGISDRTGRPGQRLRGDLRDAAPHRAGADDGDAHARSRLTPRRAPTSRWRA